MVNRALHGVLAIALGLAPVSGAAFRGVSAGDPAAPTDAVPSVADIRERILEAHGGDALATVRGFRARGRVLSVAGGVNGTYRLHMSLDGAMRTEIRYPSRTEVRILREPLAWNGGRKHQGPATPEMADSMRLQYHRWAAPFEIARGDAESLVLDGTSDEGWIRIRREWKSKLVSIYEVDPESWLIRRVRGRMENEGHPLEFVADSADWREIDGVWLPFRITTYVSGRIAAETILDRVVLEEEFDAQVFRPEDSGGGDL